MPTETLPGQPLRPWTIPNAIGAIRLALLPVFLVLALGSDDGTDWLPAVIYAGIAWGDYADGIAARVTRQYSRLGALLDPVVDRLMVVSGLVVCWKFELLPRWAIAIFVAREIVLLIAGRVAVSRGQAIEINWWGRAGVWPTMSGVFFALAGVDVLAVPLFLLGLTMALIAAVFYFRTAIRPATRPSS
ncbi:MAG TPA: CDP-alcohol phosphatidyltransferase family protein [Baekduia sp.]|nr:CDP-alcohol phosphatidyltransferase family protein [Baekduia sp.]